MPNVHDDDQESLWFADEAEWIEDAAPDDDDSCAWCSTPLPEGNGLAAYGKRFCDEACVYSYREEGTRTA